MSPRISIILSVYNGAEYINQAIESILSQTFKDFEFMIIDDGSTDNTSLILDNYKDGRIIRITNEQNLGLVKSLNKGLQIAKGEFIARMDADDISLAERFEKQVFYLDKNPNIGVLGTAMRQVDATGKVLSTFSPPLHHKEILWKMLFSTAVAHATTMMRRDILLSSGGYDESFLHTEDTELWSRLILKTHFANLPEVLYIRRIHRRAIMSMYGRVQSKRDEDIRENLLRSFIENKLLSDEEIIEAKRIKRENKRSVLKRFISKFKYVIPASLRHKLRTSIPGWFLNRSRK